MADADRESWPALYASGLSLIRLATEAGVDTKVVRAELLRCGIAIRGGGHPPAGEWRPYKASCRQRDKRRAKAAADANAEQPDAPGYPVRRMDGKGYEP